MKTTAPVYFALQPLLEEAAASFRRQAGTGIELSIFDDLADHPLLIGDPHRLQSVFRTVFNITIRHSGADTVSLHAAQLLRTESDLLLEFTLKDNGPELRPGAKPYAYYRALVRARHLIEGLGGKAQWFHHPGLPATLKFVIKYAWQTGNPAGPHRAEKPLRGRRILLAEDNEINQQVIAGLLRRQGATVEVAGDGTDAVNIYQQGFLPDLILMDLQMPRMDGLEATAYLRKAAGCTVPVIALTSGMGPEGQMRCFEAGFNQYLPKPVDPTLLMRQMRYFLLGEHAEALA